ncbi:hypothetical protein F8M41_010735 [Gigaspora margarita]|uniref:F-box domain-containing protein n=1 Tax=Gigaspora margarita TaxID=4874 RepID=A0A8H4AU95_GIGMA|nr:hypothetical protein F8M41_010735 [Gigaspora margarita]
MASKIFIGDMPELMENILKHLNNEIHSLHSCALIFSFLGEDEISALKECLEKETCQINIEFSKTLFEYTRFLKVLNLYSINKKIEELFCFESKSYTPETSMNFVINLLFKLFIENGATLDKLVVYFPDSLKLKPEIFYLLEQNMQFISHLQYLSLNKTGFSNIESTTTLLRTLAKYATKIRTLIPAYDSYKTPLFHDIIQIIKSQEQLRLIYINGIGIKHPSEFHGIISALESQKNSLQEVTIENCDWNAEFEILNNCKNLDTFRIRNCDMKLLKILNCKFSTLEIVSEYCDVSATTQFIEISGLMLKRLKLKLGSMIKVQILELEAFKSFCPNITYLELWYIEFSTQLIEVIGNLQKLQFLTLHFLWDNIDETKEELDVRVIHFAEILPLTLQYLKFWGNLQLNSCIDIFLNHCSNVPLKTLSIHHLYEEKTVNALIEFSKRNRTLNCVGLYYYLDDDVKKKVEKYVRLESYEYTDVHL